MVLPFCYLYYPSSEVYFLYHLWDTFGQLSPWYHKSNQGRKRLWNVRIKLILFILENLFTLHKLRDSQPQRIRSPSLQHLERATVSRNLDSFLLTDELIVLARSDSVVSIGGDQWAAWVSLTSVLTPAHFISTQHVVSDVVAGVTISLPAHKFCLVSDMKKY